jgi:NDP-sugar pyrophosphorylase family protein
MGVFESTHTVPFGVVRIDDRQQLEEIVEKPVHRYLASAGIYALEPAVIDLVPPGVATTMPELFQRVKAAGQGSAVFPLREYWIDIGRPDDLRQARAAYPRGFPGD